MKKTKRILNWVAIGNAICLIASLIVVLETMYQIIFKMKTLTYFGLGMTIVAFIICGSCLTYFEERWER